MNFITEDEKTKFLQIYKSNYLENIGSEKPDLLKNIFVRNEGISGIDFENFNIDTGFNARFNDEHNSTVYTPAFKRSLVKMNTIIENSNYSDTLKYTLLGKLLSDYRCANANFDERFMKFILEYTDKLNHNKNLLLNQLDIFMRSIISFIGNCDYENWERISNKAVEDAIRGVFHKFPNAIQNLPTTIKNIPKAAASTVIATGVGVKEKTKSVTQSVTDVFTGKHSRVVPPVGQRIESTTPENPKNLQQLRKLVNSVRIEFISFNDLFKNNYCSQFELVETIKQHNESPWWYRTPGLVATTAAAVNVTTSLSFGLTNTDLKTDDLAIQISSANPAFSHATSFAFAQLTNAICGPLLGLFASLAIGTLLESEFYKNLRNSNIINAKFITLINTEQKYIDIANQGRNSCSYRKESSEYISKFIESYKLMKEYNISAKDNFDKYITNLRYYLFIFDYACKTNKIVDLLNDAHVAEAGAEAGAEAEAGAVAGAEVGARGGAGQTYPQVSEKNKGGQILQQLSKDYFPLIKSENGKSRKRHKLFSRRKVINRKLYTRRSNK